MAVAWSKDLWSVPPTVLHVYLPVSSWGQSCVNCLHVSSKQIQSAENDPSCHCCWGILWVFFHNWHIFKDCKFSSYCVVEWWPCFCVWFDVGCFFGNPWQTNHYPPLNFWWYESKFSYLRLPSLSFLHRPFRVYARINSWEIATRPSWLWASSAMFFSRSLQAGSTFDHLKNWK